MAKNLKEALARHGQAAQDLDRALRDCLQALAERAEPVVVGRLRLVSGEPKRARAKM